MTNYYDVTTRWVDRELGKTTRRNLTHRSMPAEDGTIYSYGRHFPLAETLRDKRGRFRGFLLNGDRFSVTTSRHQREIRDAIDRAGVQRIIVPFSALDQAGIDRATIVPLEVTQDRMETIKHRAVHGEQPVTVRRRRQYGPPPERQAHGGQWVDYGSYRSHHWNRWNCDDDCRDQPYPHDGPMRPPRWDWVGPGSTDTVTLADGRTTPLDFRPTTADLEGAVYEWTTWRHWLGESLFRARVFARRWDKNGKPIRRWAHFLSGFDMQESRPLYFLSELPTKGSTTIAEAYEELKPETVKVAESMGRTVYRQGDVFAVETNLTTRDLTRMGATREKGAHILATNHKATEVARMNGTTLVRGTLTHDPGAWRRPDHKRVTLGDRKSWHIVVKNTVPVG